MNVVFLDRDGVINRYPGDFDYVKNADEFHLLPGSACAIKRLNDLGFKVFVVSNQAGVSKKIYTQSDLDAIDKKMHDELACCDAKLDGIYYCTHLDEHACNCRKPKDGLLHKALDEHNITPEKVFFIGDSFMDMTAARSFGACAILVLSGKETQANKANWPFIPDFIFEDLKTAVEYICNNYV
ncbi:MAG: HAD-IIIA family hydrolase [Candidatus Omnitrophica bacterium]|nr:HAD-IIIA family hydrolase [Candidatus Omnitrophota bacterium]MDD5080618.1 HAD-IIIA family hydrolase [Candidatus Omnitrophota bacterium]MDD5441491.1 HAD-IIIA family hydrolase [Candidatus Omnitrophota bacterium]